MTELALAAFAVFFAAVAHSLPAGRARQTLMRLAGEEGIRIEARAFTPAEAREAEDAFLTSATVFVRPVIAIDGQSGRRRARPRHHARARDVYRGGHQGCGAPEGRGMMS